MKECGGVIQFANSNYCSKSNALSKRKIFLIISFPVQQLTTLKGPRALGQRDNEEGSERLALKVKKESKR